MKRAAAIVVLGFCLCFVFSCRYDSEEELYPQDEEPMCDTLNVSLSNTIRPILNANCYSCHSASNASVFGAGINLENYSELQNIAQSGRIIGAITHSPGFVAMPLEGIKLDECSINKIKAWINNGALDN